MVSYNQGQGNGIRGNQYMDRSKVIVYCRAWEMVQRLKAFDAQAWLLDLYY